MAAEKKNKIGPDTDSIRELAGILEETGLTEIELEQDGVRLRVARQAAPAAPVAYAPPPPQSQGGAPQQQAAAPAAGGAPSAADHPGAVKSPMVGTAYLAPSPGAAPFVKEGGSVTEGQTVLIVEAMKTMNPITAPRSGVVSKVLVSDAQPVEFEEALLIIE